MGIEREKGYEYKGFKLGQKIKLKEDNKIYTIIGFNENRSLEESFMAINKNESLARLKENIATSYLGEYKDSKSYWIGIRNLNIELINKGEQVDLKELHETLSKYYDLKNFRTYYIELGNDLEKCLGKTKVKFTTETFNGIKDKELEINKKYIGKYIEDELGEINKKIDEIEKELEKLGLLNKNNIGE